MKGDCTFAFFLNIKALRDLYIEYNRFARKMIFSSKLKSAKMVICNIL